MLTLSTRQCLLGGDHSGKTVDAELRGNDPNAQKDLPLNQHGEGESTGKKRGRRRTNGEGARAH